MWQSAEINGQPFAAVYDGAILRLINLNSQKIVKSHEFHKINAFNQSLYVRSRIYRYDHLFFFSFNQRFIKAFDSSFEEITPINFDSGMAILAMHWDEERSYLYLAGTNGWLKCFHLISVSHVADFIAEWKLIFEIRSTEDWIVSLAHDPVSKTLYGIANTTLYAWEMETGVFKFRLPDLHDKYRLCEVDVLPDSNFVVTSALDGTIKIWNVQLSVCKLYSVIPSFSTGYLSFSVQGRFIVTNGSDRIIRLFRIGNENPLCQINLSDETQKPNIEEVVIVGIQTMAINGGDDGYVCITSYKNNFDAVAIGFAPEDYITSSYPINYMAYIEDRKELMCICENNLIITKDKTYDLDMITDDNSKRSPASETVSLCVTKDKLITGHKNGAVKLIDNESMKGRMIENVELDDVITCLEVVKGMFVGMHQTCGSELNLTDEDQEFIISYSKSGSIHVWCEKCGLQIIDQKLNKKDVKMLKVVKKENLVLIAFDRSVAAYITNGNSFTFAGQISTSGNQSVTSFDVTDDLTLIIGTSSGEIIVSELERDDNNFEFNINVRHSITPGCCGALKIFIIPGTRICACCFEDGLIHLLEFDRMITLSSDYFTDADPLSSVLFVYNEEENMLIVFLAFSLHVHCYQLSLQVPEIIEVEEEPEPEPEPAAVEEDSNEFETVDLSFMTQPETTADLSKLFAEEKKQRKREVVVEKIDIKSKTTIEDLPKPAPKLTLEEVIARNEAKAAEILGSSRTVKRANPVKQRRTKTSFQREREAPRNFGVDLTLTNFSYKDVPKPVSLSELKKTIGHAETARVVSREQPLQTQTRAVSREVKLDIGEDKVENEENFAESRDLMFPTTPGTWMIQKKSKEQVSTIPIATLKKTFVAPPQSYRILFDDATTLNSLSFYDPRGFSAKFETEEERERKRLEEEAKKAAELAAKELAKTARIPPQTKPVAKPEPQRFVRAQSSVEKKNFYPMVRRSQSRNSTMEFKPLTATSKRTQSTAPSRLTESAKIPPKQETLNNQNPPKQEIPPKAPVVHHTKPAPKPEKKEPQIIITTEKKPREKLVPLDTKPPKKQVEPKKKPSPKPKPKPAKTKEHKEEKEKPEVEQKAPAKQESLTAREILFSELIKGDSKPQKPKKRVYVEKKTVYKTKESEFANLKNNKIEDLSSLGRKRLKARDINAEVKAAMHSTKITPKMKRAMDNRKDKEDKKKKKVIEEEKPVEIPPTPTQTPTPPPQPVKVEPQTNVKPETPPKQTQQEEPIKRKARKWIDNGLNLEFRDGNDINGKKEADKYEITDYLPSLAPLWEQKHIYPNLPIKDLSQSPPKRFCINENQLDNSFPDMSPNPFVNKNIFSDFEAIFAYQCGLDNSDEKCFKDDPNEARPSGLETFRKKQRRTSF